MEHKDNVTGETTEETTPGVIDLGDAAILTKGSDNSGVESKQTPYDA